HSQAVFALLALCQSAHSEVETSVVLRDLCLLLGPGTIALPSLSLSSAPAPGGAVPATASLSQRQQQQVASAGAENCSAMLQSPCWQKPFVALLDWSSEADDGDSAGGHASESEHDSDVEEAEEPA